MSRNAAGIYSLPLPSVVPGTLITADWANTTLNDVATALTDSLDRLGRGGMVAPFKTVSGNASNPGYGFSALAGAGMYLSATASVNFCFAGGDLFNIASTGTQFTAPVTVPVPTLPQSAASKKYIDDLFTQSGYIGLPPASTSIGTVPNTDIGKCVYATGYVQMDASWKQGDVLTVINTTALPITIGGIGGLVLYLAGTTTNGVRTLATNGVASIIWLSNTKAIVSGTSLT